MKKRTIITLGLLMATCFMQSCDSTPSSTVIQDPTENIEKALIKARETVNFNGNITAIYVDDGDTYNEGELDFSITDSFMEWKKTFKDASNNTVNYDYSFFKDNDNKMAYKKLNLRNEVQTYQFLNPKTDKVMDYDTYCANPFKSIDALDFELIEERLYLDESKLSLFKGLVDLSSVTNYILFDFEISSVSFGFNGDKFTDVIITTSPREDYFINPADFFYDCSFNLIFPGELTMTEIKTKTHREEHTILDNALKEFNKAFEGKNYTIHAEDVESGGEFGASYDNYATDKGFFSDFKVEMENYKYGYALKDDGKYYRYSYCVSGDKKGTYRFYTAETSYRYCKEREDLEPDFTSFASEFFIKSNNSFITTNSDVSTEIFKKIAPFNDSQYTFEANKIFFNLEDNKIVSWGAVVSDISSGYVDTITYTIKDVGTTKLPVEVA